MPRMGKTGKRLCSWTCTHLLPTPRPLCPYVGTRDVWKAHHERIAVIGRARHNALERSVASKRKPACHPTTTRHGPGSPHPFLLWPTNVPIEYLSGKRNPAPDLLSMELPDVRVDRHNGNANGVYRLLDAVGVDEHIGSRFPNSSGIGNLFGVPKKLPRVDTHKRALMPLMSLWSSSSFSIHNSFT